MSRSSLRRLLTVAASTAALAVVAVPSPALAGDFFFSKASGTMVSVSWLEVGELPPEANAPGNAHFGELFVDDLGRGRASVFGTVHDVQCEEGVTPYLPGNGHGEKPQPDPEEGCQLALTRFIEGGDVTFRVDRKLTQATLTGTLAVGQGHGEGPVGQPPVSISWTGQGATVTEKMSGLFEDEYGMSRFRYTFIGRDADVRKGSRIGPMIFDDEAGEFSESRLGKYRQSDRTRF